MNNHQLMTIACLAYVFRVVWYTSFQNPWLVLVVEPLHGVTFACKALGMHFSVCGFWMCIWADTVWQYRRVSGCRLMQYTYTSRGVYVCVLGSRARLDMAFETRILMCQRKADACPLEAHVRRVDLRAAARSNAQKPLPSQKPLPASDGSHLTRVEGFGV